jgi:riboflavin synthase
MFTGIIEEVGHVAEFEQRASIYRLIVSAPALAPQLKTGDSIAVSGVCLTAFDITADTFSADLAEETVARTTLSCLGTGSLVNLELPRRAGTPLGGHIVQGHIDAAGTLISLRPVQENADGSGDWWLEVEFPRQLERYIVEKGSIAIEGISLTIAKVDGNRIGIAIIPHTYKATNLSSLKPGDLVNIEVDVMAKYAEKRGSETAAASKLTLEELVQRGF